jgi:soluble lytic murein transglycosylase
MPPPNAFATVARRSTDLELGAAGHYWAARADMMCAPARSGSRRAAQRRALKETFYGLLAARRSASRRPDFAGLHDYRDAEWQHRRKPNVRAALALNEIGETRLADEFIKHQARIGGASDHNALLHLAADLNLAGTQYWLAHNAPRGTGQHAARYPMPDWRRRAAGASTRRCLRPRAPGIELPHQVVSPAGAVGLMQVRPGTAGDIARARGEPFDPSSSPSRSSTSNMARAISNICATITAPAACSPR